MKRQIVAKAYARSVMSLGKEQKIDVAKEMLVLSQLILSNNDLENLLYLDIFTYEEKESILKVLFDRLELSTLSQNFMHVLLAEHRMALFPLIFKELTLMDDHEKGFVRGEIFGRSDKIPEKDSEILNKYIMAQLKRKPVLTYHKSDKVSAGYKVVVEDLELDASIDHQLAMLKNSILGV